MSFNDSLFSDSNIFAELITGVYAHDRRVLEQFAHNIHIKPDMTCVPLPVIKYFKTI